MQGWVGSTRAGHPLCQGTAHCGYQPRVAWGAVLKACSQAGNIGIPWMLDRTENSQVPPRPPELETLREGPATCV